MRVLKANYTKKKVLENERKDNKRRSKFRKHYKQQNAINQHKPKKYIRIFFNKSDRQEKKGSTNYSI